MSTMCRAVCAVLFISLLAVLKQADAATVQTIVDNYEWEFNGDRLHALQSSMNPADIAYDNAGHL